VAESKKGEKTMKVQDFVLKLEELGFIDDGLRLSPDDFVRSYRAPERLATAVEYLNLGGTRGREEYSVTFQPPESGLVDTLGLPVSFDTMVMNGVETWYRELGTELSPFCRDADEALLDALSLDAERFLRWLYHQPLAVMQMTNEDGDEVDGVLRGDGIEPLKPGPKQ